MYRILFVRYAVSVDTLYINVKYPRRDVFDRWYRVIKNFDSRVTRLGIPEGDFVVRGGTQGYLASVWRHDIRAYLTDRVDEKIGDGMGMGIWMQIGPKFLLDHPPGVELRKAVRDFLKDLGVKKDWPIRITRIDVAVDLFGVAISDQSVELWRQGWVGRAGVSSTYFNSESRLLETVNIGSRESAIFLRIYDKVAQAESEGDIDYWWDVWDGYSGPLTRVEWEVKPKKGGFFDIEDFSTLCEWKVVELLNKLVEWGRLCIPNPSDSNNRRWEIAEFWKLLLSVSEEWADGITWPTSRIGKTFKGVNESYMRGLAGQISTGMARLAPERPSLYNMLDELDQHGLGLVKIQKDADSKAEIFKRV
jgi:hypothetical protein